MTSQYFGCFIKNKISSFIMGSTGFGDRMVWPCIGRAKGGTPITCPYTLKVSQFHAAFQKYLAWLYVDTSHYTVGAPPMEILDLPLSWSLLDGDRAEILCQGSLQVWVVLSCTEGVQCMLLNGHRVPLGKTDITKNKYWGVEESYFSF